MGIGRMTSRSMALALAALVVIGSGLWLTTRALGAASPEPGSPEDPLVTRSYVEQYVQQLFQDRLQEAVQKQAQPALQQLQQAVQAVPQQVQTAVREQLPAAIQQQVQAAVREQLPAVAQQQLQTKVQDILVAAAQQAQFAVVNVSKGTRLMAKGGTELVLRAGQATVIASNLGGLADLSTGQDLGQGQPVAPNHHLLVPRDDGRGVVAVTDIVLLVRGSYSLQSAPAAR